VAGLEGKLIRLKVGGNERIAYVIFDQGDYVRARFWVGSAGRWDLGGPKSGYFIPRERILGELAEDDKRRHQIAAADKARMHEPFTDEELLSYLSAHAQTELGLVHRDHLMRLYTLAGVEPGFDLRTRVFWGTSPSMIDPLVDRARERMHAAKGGNDGT
jgi:hypothetical protein